ncbi:MAG: RdgB/HAM1 family non-canonical purine NTP pyrophosphatase [Halioglobus sp.]
MSHPADPQIVVLASGNSGKLAEFSALLKPLNMQLKFQSEFQTPEVPEDGLSFVENAIIKARAAAKHTGHPALADDSGLEVGFLNGAPGIYSARFSGVNGEHADRENNARLLRELEGVPQEQRNARFVCVLVYMRHWQDPTPLVCQGTWDGQILTQPSGINGFGYDPLFFVPTYNCSSAELVSADKNRISHRAQASQKLLEALRGR